MTGAALTRPRYCIAVATFALALTLAGCAGGGTAPGATQPTQPPPPLPRPSAPEVSPQQRSQLHTDLAAGYYERGQMGVALDELSVCAGRMAPASGASSLYGSATHRCYSR